MTNEPIRCPQCDQPLTRVGQFWVCPEHGQVSLEQPFVPLRIFLSYGHDSNEELVRRIKADLEQRGHDVWFDKTEIKAGDDWRRSITDGIAQSHQVVSFLSKHSTRDPGVCRDEIAIAIGVKGGNIQTILVESEQQVQPPQSISHIQWLDMHDWKQARGVVGTKKDKDDNPYAVGDAAWEEWYQAKFDEIVRVVESDESRRFAGEIETLGDHLKPIKSEARICQLLSKGFYGRQWLFEAVETWRQDTKLERPSGSESRLFWIMGAPGVGKSAFAAQLTHTRGDTVIAAQFCEWDKADQRDARRVVRSIAFQLATRLPDYRKLLLTLPEIAELDRKDAAELFDYLLANPLRSVIHGGRQRYLIVIDALDEAGEAGRNPLVDMLARNAHLLPDWLGLIVTSRPEFDVKTPLQALNPFPFDTESESNRADIRDYLRRELASHLQIRPDADRLVEQILEKSEGVFLYVEHVCRECQCGNLSLDRLDEFPQCLGGIFFQYFQRQFPDENEFATCVEPVLAAIVGAREPLPVTILQELFGWGEAEIQRWLRDLGSLFPLSERNRQEVVRPYHKSLADWVTEIARAGVYFVSASDGRRLVGNYCVQKWRTADGALPGYVKRNLAAHLLHEQRWRELDEAIASPHLELLNRWTARGEQLEGEACLRAVIGHLVQKNELQHAAELSAQRARVLTQLGQHADAESQLRQSLSWAAGSGGGATQAVAWHELGSLLFYRGAYGQALACYERALELARQQSPINHAETAANLIGLATVARARQRHARAIAWAREGLAEAEKCGDVRHIVAARRILAGSLRYQMQMTEAEFELGAARMVCILHDLPFDLTAIMVSQAWLAYERAVIEGWRDDGAPPLFDAALDQARQAKHLFSQVEAGLGLTWCALRNKDELLAAQHLKEASATPGAENYQELAADLRVGWAGLALLQGNLKAAEDLYTQARKISQRSGQLSIQADACVGLAAVYHRQEDLEKSRAAEQDAVKLAQACGPLKLQLVQRSLAHVKADQQAVPY